MKKNTSGTELHTIQNEKRPRVIKKHSGKTAFKAKYHRRLTQVLAMFSCFAILGVGIVAIGSIFNKADPNEVDPGFVTVSYELPTDGSRPVDHGALENIGYMNKRFSAQTKWYSEMHGTTLANTMGINVNQSVNTYKQYDNETLIMADITASSMVNKARQFCYRGDEVIWRMGSGSSSTWPTGEKGEDCFSKLAAMQWQDGTPYGHMSLESFTRKNGLPGTGFSVYVINEETLLNADEVIDHGDGTYSQTYYLDPAVDKAPCHYVNQMVFTGDLPSLPSFNYITVTYTFDNTWQILRSEIDEQYTAVMGVSATCTSAYRTDFEYGTHKAESTAFSDYFKTHFGAPFTEPDDNKQEITPLNCLTSAFASVLTQPVTFDLDLCINGNATAGKVYVDVGEMTLETMDIRAQIGSMKVWLTNGAAFVEYGGMKIKLTVSELVDFIGSLTGSGEGGFSLDTDALLGALAEGEFTYDGQSATLSSTLSLGFDLPVVFHFNVDEEGNVSLGNVLANLVFDNLAVSSFNLGKLEIGAALQFGEGGLNALNEQDQAQFIDLVPLARDVVAVLRSDVLAIDLSYRGEGFAVEGTLDLALGDLSSFGLSDLTACDLAVQGSIRVTIGGAEKTVPLAYRKGVLYLEIDGVKLKADVKEGIALISQLVPSVQSGTAASNAPFDLGKILSGVFTDDFARLFASTQTENGAEILLQGTQLLKQFGVNYALGDVKLSFGNGSIGASAAGVQACISASKNTIAPVDDAQYAAVLPYVQPVLSLMKSEAIAAEVNFENGGLSLVGTISVSMQNRAAQGTLTVGYTDGKAEIFKTLQFAYLYSEDGGTLYLAVDGLKVQAQAGELIGVLTTLLGKELPQINAENGDLLALLEKLLAFDFGKLLSVNEDGETLGVVVFGSELLRSLGIEFDLGNVSLSINKTGIIEVDALGAHVTLSAGAYQAPVTEGYTDISAIISALPAVWEHKSLAFSGSFTLQAGNTAINVTIENGALGFADGLNLYAALQVNVGGNSIGAVLNVTTEEIAFVVDGLAARVRFSEFKDIASAVSALYKQLAAAVNGFIVTGEEDGVLADDIEKLMQKLGVAELLAGFAQQFDLSLVDKIAIGAPERADGICTIAFGAFKAELLNAGEGRILGAALSFADEKFTLSGGVSVFEGSVPAMPAVEYLGASDFIELIDYAGAAVNTITANNLSVVFRKGNVVERETENGTETVKEYDVTGKIEYYSGGKYPFVINTADKTVTVNADLYAHVDFVFLDKNNVGEGIFLTLELVDYDRNGVLDFFVTLSRFAADHAKYQPLKLYADANELMDVLSCACAMLGVNFDFINDYLVAHYLDVTTAAQLRTLGNSLLKSFGVGDLFAALAGGATATAEQTNFIREIVVGKERFTIDAGGYRIEIGKTASTDETGAVRSYLTGVGVQTGDLCVEVALDALSAVTVPTVTLDESYFKLEGIARLVKLLATSATQPDENSETGYALGDHYYIDGKITLNMVLNLFGGISVKGVDVKLALSVSVGEDGEVSADIHVEVPGVAVMSYVAIDGRTATDITLKDGMIYMKRVQYTYYDGSTEKNYPNPVTVYRVMPIASFTDDLLNQLAFALNFGKLITDNLGGTSSGGEETPTETTDFGALLQKYIVSCVYAEKSDGTCAYTLTLNGDSLLKGYLGNVVVQIGSAYLADGSEVISDLGITTTLSVSVLKIDVSGALRFENPCGIAANEITTDVAGIVSTAMEKALAEAQQAEWKDIPYIEGQTTTVSYVLAGETVAAQDVLFNAKTGECYANLKAPDSAQFEHKGYDIVWDFSDILHESDGKYYISANQIVYGSYRAKTYTLTLSDGNDWTVQFDYVYGTDLLAEINKAYATQHYSAVSCSLTADDVANGEREGLVVWETHNYAVTYYDQEGKEFSKQFYKADAALVYPENAPARVGYLFDGWQNADGERVENGSAVTQDTALYPVWKVDDRKEITVRLYSDLRYENAAFDPEQDGYYTEVTFDEQTGYELSALQSVGYQQMGWWYLEENGDWSRVTSVEGKNGAVLWAVWIRNIKVEVTNFAKKNSTFTIEGKVEGGAVYGKKSKEIYVSAGMSESTTGVYTIYSSNGKKSDNLKYGSEIGITYGEDGVGTFSSSGMTSFNALFWNPGVGYGGIRITKTFSYGNGLSVSTESASYVSLSTYTVTFQNENGETIRTIEGVRIDYPYDDYDNSVYIDELAAREGIAVPVKEGYAGSWEHTAVTGNITVKPVYTA